MVYLCLGGKRISFIRLPVTEFISADLKVKVPKLYYLKPERSVAPDIRHDLAGIVRLRLGILYEAELRNEVFAAWDATFKKPDFNPGILIANVYHCKELIPSDNEGTSDPFITVSYLGNEGTSSVIEQSLNPVWNERIYTKIPISLSGADGLPNYDDAVILIKIFDKDSIKVLDTQLYSNDEFLGAGTVEVYSERNGGNVALNKSDPAYPKWVNLECILAFIFIVLIEFCFYINRQRTECW